MSSTVPAPEFGPGSPITPAGAPDVAPATAAPAPRPKVRNPYWDNARAITILLVVIGHAIQPLNSQSDLSYGTYLFIYAFHMPAFAILAGYFSKAEPSREQVGRIVTDLLVPYLIMETIWTAVQFVVEGSTRVDPTTASWTLWFLLALAIFRLLLPLLARLRAPVTITIAISVLVPFFDNVDETFSLARALGLLPFFLIGWVLSDRGVMERARWFDRPRGSRTVVVTRAVAATLMIGALTMFLLGTDLWRSLRLGTWLYYSNPYEEFAFENWWAGALMRLGLIGIALLLTVALLVLVPRSPMPFSSIGQASLYVYLLHTFPLYPLRQLDLTGEGAPAEVWFVGLILFSVLLTVLLASRPVKWLTRPLIEPRVAWLLRKG